MVKTPASTAGSTCSIPGLGIKIPIPHAAAKIKINSFKKSYWKFGILSNISNKDSFFFFLEHLIFIIPIVFKILTHIVY